MRNPCTRRRSDSCLLHRYWRYRSRTLRHQNERTGDNGAGAECKGEARAGEGCESTRAESSTQPRNFEYDFSFRAVRRAGDEEVRHRLVQPAWLWNTFPTTPVKSEMHNGQSRKGPRFRHLRTLDALRRRWNKGWGNDYHRCCTPIRLDAQVPKLSRLGNECT